MSAASPTSSREFSDGAGPIHVSTPASVLLLLGIIAAGTVLRFLYLDRKSFWLDEGVSVAIARLDWANLACLLWRREANMALYYGLLRIWLHFGSSEFFVRALSALLSVASIPATYLLGKRLFGTAPAIIAAALFSVHAWQVRYAQEARSYSLYVLLTSLSCLFFLRLLEWPSRRNMAGYAIFSTLAVYSHLFAVLVIGAQCVFFYLRRRDPPLPREFRDAMKILGLLVLPLIVFVVSRGAGLLSWIPRPGLSSFHQLALFLTSNGDDMLLLLYAASGIAGLFAGRQSGGSQSNLTPQQRNGFLLLWLLFPILLTLGFSLLRPVFLPRYLLACATPLVLLASAGLARLRPRWLAGAFLVLMLGFSVRGVLNYYNADFDLQREDWRSAARGLLVSAQPGDGILFHSAQARMPFEYYAGALPARNSLHVLFPAYGDQLTSMDFLANARNAPLNEIPRHYTRVWLILAHNRLKDGQLDSTTQALQNFLAASYAQQERQEFAGPIEVLLYAAPKTSESQ